MVLGMNTLAAMTNMRSGGEIVPGILLMGAPSEATPQQLRELHLRLAPTKKD